MVLISKMTREDIFLLFSLKYFILLTKLIQELTLTPLDLFPISSIEIDNTLNLLKVSKKSIRSSVNNNPFVIILQSNLFPISENNSLN